MRVEVPIRKLAEWQSVLEHILGAPNREVVYLSKNIRKVLSEILVWISEVLDELEEVTR